jgi:hypothetical protein
LVVLAGLALFAGGCAVADGEPWGWLEGDAEARGELVEPGGAPTDGVSIDSVEAFFRVRLAETQTTSGGSGASFDPASPPPGYTLCHNGHCHSEGGDLVSYEDVREELNNGGGTSVVTIGRVEGGGTLDGNPVDIGRTAIVNEAQIDTIEVQVNLDIRGTVTIDGADYDLVILTSPFLMSTQTKLSFGPGEPFEQFMHMQFDWTGIDAFEDVDIDALDRSSDTVRITQVVNRSAAESIVSALQEGAIELMLER